MNRVTQKMQEREREQLPTYIDSNRQKEKCSRYMQERAYRC